MSHRVRKIDAWRFEIPKTGGMLVPGLVYASERMIPKIEQERVAEQIENSAHLPGVVDAVLAMPDCHWGYGMPIGGVAAMDVDQGVISPGAVGYDISCGVRLVRSDLKAEAVKARVEKLMDALDARVASGVGKGGPLRVGKDEMGRVLSRGARWAVEKGFGDREDLEAAEEEGRVPGADPDAVSRRAQERGSDQVGTLGSGNHFLELQEVEEVFDPGIGAVFGLFPGQLVVLLHTGSRGLGYQVCSDSLSVMQGAVGRYGIRLPDRQLACAPLGSPEGRAYFGAMAAAANYALANRQVITHFIRESFMRGLDISPRDLGMRLVYDVSHNLARMETHGGRRLCVHRKGATRAFPAGHPDVPAMYRGVGQPVLVPGSMGTFSYVLVGTGLAMTETFGSVCHGAGRTMSRSQALKQTSGHQLLKDLNAKGIAVRTEGLRGLAEEAPAAYKDVSEVVDVCERAGLARKVARMKPLGVLKG
ncbi:MAG: RtcB family protein [Elusimicrobiota bacterium]